MISENARSHRSPSRRSQAAAVRPPTTKPLLLSQRTATPEASLLTEEHLGLRSRAEAEIWARTLFDALPFGVEVRDAATEFVYANPAFLRLVHLTAGQLNGHEPLDAHWQIRFEDCGAQTLGWLAAQVVARHTTVHCAASLALPTGEVRQLSLDAVPIPLTEGAVVQVVTCVHDVNQHVQEVRAGELAAGRFHALMAALDDLVIVLGASGTPLYRSPRALEVLAAEDWTNAAAPGLPFVHPDHRAALRSAISRCTQQEAGSVATRVDLRQADFQWHPYTITARNSLADPAVRGVVLVATPLPDPPTSENMSDRWQQRQPEVQQTSGGTVSPLTAVVGLGPEAQHALVTMQGLSELLRDHELSPADIHEYAASIHAEATRLLDLVEALEREHQQRSRQAALSLAAFDLNQLLARLVVERPPGGAPAVLFPDSALPHLVGDEAKLRSAFDVLLDLLGVHPVAGATIAITTSVQGQMVQVDVAIHAPPAEPAEDQQGSGSAGVRPLVDYEESTGLSFVRHTVQLHGGQLLPVTAGQALVQAQVVVPLAGPAVRR